MSKFIYTKQYRQFEEFCKATHRDRYIGLCYGAADVGKTESAKHSKWCQIESYRDANGRLNTGIKPKIQMSKSNTILHTPSVLNPPKDMIREIRHFQREFSLLKEQHIYGGIIERVIGTMMKLVHTLPGTTFSNIKEKGDYPSEHKACLTLGELERWLIIAITKYYHLRFIPEFLKHR